MQLGRKQLEKKPLDEAHRRRDVEKRNTLTPWDWKQMPAHPHQENTKARPIPDGAWTKLKLAGDLLKTLPDSMFPPPPLSCGQKLGCAINGNRLAQTIRKTPEPQSLA